MRTISFAFAFLFYVLNSFTTAQINSELEQKVKQIINTNTAHEQYNALAELMEFDAQVTLEEASYYLKLFSSPTYQAKDSRYPLLAHFILADVCYYNDKTDTSLYHYLSLASEAIAQEENMLAASGLGNASYVLSDMGDKLGAINLLKENLDISANTGDIRDYTDHTYNIANNYSDLGLRDSAIFYFEKTIDLDRQSNNKSGMLYNMHILLDQYLEGMKIDEALNICEECIQVATELKDLRAKARCRSSQAQALFYFGEPEKALKAVEEAIRIDEERGDTTRMSRYYRVKAKIYQEKGEYVRSNTLFRQSIEFAEQYTSKEDLIEARLDFASSLLAQKSTALAEDQARQAEGLLENYGLLKYASPLLEVWKNISFAKGDLQSAVTYLNQQNKRLKSQLERNVLAVTEQSKNSYDLFKMENINRSLEAEKELAEAKVKRRNTLIASSAIILLLIGTAIYFAYQNKNQKTKLKAQQLEFQVVEKELLALRSQMNPHFLFNSLNSINDYIMHEEPRLASRYLTKFSNLMRTILNHSKEKLISLEDEVQANKLYVEMEKLRFTNAFEFEIDIDKSIQTDAIKIPSMLLQPYLENAIKHGLRNSNVPGKLSLQVNSKGNALEFRIRDNGVGRAEAERLKRSKKNQHKSHGMEITADRITLLNQMYSMDARVEIIDLQDPSGTEVILQITPHQSA